MDNLNDINELIENMSYEDLGKLVLTKACNIQENKDIDIIDLLNTCMLVINAIKENTTISPSELFYTMQYIMSQLENVANEGGKLEIYTINK